MEPSVHDEDKLMNIINRLKMSTVIIYYYIDFEWEGE